MTITTDQLPGKPDRDLTQIDIFEYAQNRANETRQTDHIVSACEKAWEAKEMMGGVPVVHMGSRRGIGAGFVEFFLRPTCYSRCVVIEIWRSDDAIRNDQPSAFLRTAHGEMGTLAAAHLVIGSVV